MYVHLTDSGASSIGIKKTRCNSPGILHHAECLMCLYAGGKAIKATRVIQFPKGIASRLLWDVYWCRRQSKKHERGNSPGEMASGLLSDVYVCRKQSKKHEWCNSRGGIASRLLSDVYVCRRQSKKHEWCNSQGGIASRVLFDVYIYRRQPKKHEWCNSPGELHHACCLMCMYAGGNQRNTSHAIPQGELHHPCCMILETIKETRVMQFPKGNCIMFVVWCVCMYVEGNIKITRVMQFPRGTCITLVVWCVCMPKAIKKHEWGSMARRFGASWLFLEDFMRFHDFDGQRFSSLEQRFLRGKISAAKTATGCET